MKQLKRTVRISRKDRIADAVITRCLCGVFQYITDIDAEEAGVFECTSCGAPFALIDVFGNVYQVGQRIRKGAESRV